MTSPCRTLTQTGVRDGHAAQQDMPTTLVGSVSVDALHCERGLHCELVVGSVAREYRHGFDILDAAGLPSGTVYPILPHSRPRGSAASRWENAATQREKPR